MMHNTLARLLLIVLLAAPAIGSAQTPTDKPKPLFDSIKSVVAKACEAVGYVFTAAIIITIIFVLLAGIKYIVHGSDPGKIAEAHKQLMWAAIGFAIAIIARTMPFIIATVLGDPNLLDPCSPPATPKT
jgi:hypothetical protein